MTIRFVKNRGKWIIEGDGEGWIFHKKFPAKWKSEIAMSVFKQGGRVQKDIGCCGHYPKGQS